MQTETVTRNFEEALKEVCQYKGSNNYAALAGDPSTFRFGINSPAGFFGLWDLEDGLWGLGLGVYRPSFIGKALSQSPTRQMRMTIPRTWTDVQLVKRSEWNFFAIESATEPQSPNLYQVEALDSDQEITAFIDRCAPDSSTRPGDSEIIFWHGIRDSEGVLRSIGAAVRWKTAATMLVSIATDPIARGRSMAQEVTASLVKRLFDLGSPVVGLGVWAQNTPAIRAYEKVGFKLQEEFVSGPLLQP
ncbi:MAG TPA: GNAT family N-acetyltransferase [Candidatus Nanopelagicaceae bacterium]|nr:GNAT family N-acetyltransferase [Candidatus Nanopelagicaceae bacterium]